jgi:hypothetical protein
MRSDRSPTRNDPGRDVTLQRSRASDQEHNRRLEQEVAERNGTCARPTDISTASGRYWSTPTGNCFNSSATRRT